MHQARGSISNTIKKSKKQNKTLDFWFLEYTVFCPDPCHCTFICLFLREAFLEPPLYTHRLISVPTLLFNFLLRYYLHAVRCIDLKYVTQWICICPRHLTAIQSISRSPCGPTRQFYCRANPSWTSSHRWVLPSLEFHRTLPQFTYSFYYRWTFGLFPVIFLSTLLK